MARKAQTYSRGQPCKKCGNDEWYAHHQVTPTMTGGPACRPCLLARGRKNRGAGPRPKRTKIHPRVLRAIRTTAGGRKRKAGTRTIKLRARDPVEVDAQALRDAWDAQGGICAISGLPMITDGRYHRHPHYAEPDRIDPNYGYVAGNVQWVRKCFNEWKSDAPLEALVTLGEWAQRKLKEAA